MNKYVNKNKNKNQKPEKNEKAIDSGMGYVNEVLQQMCLGWAQ